MSGPHGAQHPPPPVATPPPANNAPADWYADPWHQAAWRWYDGQTWTGHIHGQVTPVAPATTGLTSAPADHANAHHGQLTHVGLVAPPKKPFLPSFLSWPVLLAALPGLGFMGWVLVAEPSAFGLGLVPLLIVLPVLFWIDRTEPEPRSAKWHSFLWGAFVAGLISVIVNTIVAVIFGDTVAAVASAPTIEEITKGLGIVWMVKRKQVDGPMDGIVYAGWTAAGFAMIENMSYFQFAAEEDLLVGTFIGRGLLTPFAHPLFSMWTGLAVGLAVRARKSPWQGLWGLVLAMALHAAWNGSLSFGESDEALAVIGIAILLFVALFIAAGIGIARLRSRDEKRYIQLVPFLASRYQINPDRVALLIDRKNRRMARVNIKDKEQQRRFRMEANAMLRLAALLDHDDMPVPEDEARLYSQLVAART